MSDKKELKRIKEEYGEAMKFQDVVKELNFKSVGEFVELIGGVFGMLNINDIDNAKAFSQAFAERIGHILLEIGHVDKIIAGDKSMRDFYKEQLIKEDEIKAKKEVEEKIENPAITLELTPELKESVANLTKTSTAKYVGGGWFELDNGERIRGKNNLPESVVVQ